MENHVAGAGLAALALLLAAGGCRSIEPQMEAIAVAHEALAGAVADGAWDAVGAPIVRIREQLFAVRNFVDSDAPGLPWEGPTVPQEALAAAAPFDRLRTGPGLDPGANGGEASAPPGPEPAPSAAQQRAARWHRHLNAVESELDELGRAALDADAAAARAVLPRLRAACDSCHREFRD